MTVLLEMNRITKHFNHGKKINEILEEVNLCVNSGEIIGIIGLNGSGKTTLLKIAYGLLTPDSGMVSVSDKVNRVSILGDGNRSLYWNLSGLENINYFFQLNNFSDDLPKDKLYEYLDFFNMHNYINNKVITYSKGMKQKLLIIIAFLNSPNLIIMDEPLNGLDLEASLTFQQYLLNYVKENQASVLLTSHNGKFLSELCSKIYKIENRGLVRENNLKAASETKTYRFYFHNPCEQTADKHLRVSDRLDVYYRDFQLNDASFYEEISREIKEFNLHILSIKEWG